MNYPTGDSSQTLAGVIGNAMSVCVECVDSFSSVQYDTVTAIDQRPVIAIPHYLIHVLFLSNRPHNFSCQDAVPSPILVNPNSQFTRKCIIHRIHGKVQNTMVHMIIMGTWEHGNISDHMSGLGTARTHQLLYNGMSACGNIKAGRTQFWEGQKPMSVSGSAPIISLRLELDQQASKGIQFEGMNQSAELAFEDHRCPF